MSNLLKLSQAIQRKDIVWTDNYLSKTPFHAGFWVQNRIGKAIQSTANLAKGTLLDVGCGAKPYEKLFAPFVDKYIGLEYSPESGYRGNKADFCGDAGLLPLADSSIDTILCTEVMEHVPHPEKTIEEFARVLRSDGVLITTAPFAYPVHDAYDFFRYSPDGLNVIMNRYGFDVEEVKPLSGTAVTLSVLFNLYWYDVGFIWTKWLYPVGLMLRPVLWLSCLIVNLLGGLFEQIIPSTHLAFNHLTIARKNEPNKSRSRPRS